MSCILNVTYEPKTVWTIKSSANWVFHPMSEAMSSTGVDKIRVSFALQASTGDIKIRPSLQVSNDGISWDTAVNIGTATLSSNGESFGSDYEDMSATTKTKLFVRFGIEAQNASGSTLDMGIATLHIDCARG